MSTSQSLVLSRDNLLNSSLDCDSLGIHYQFATETGVFKTGKITQVRRWHNRSRQFVPVAEWERHHHDRSRPDIFKFLSGEEVPVSKFLIRKNRPFRGVSASFLVHAFASEILTDASEDVFVGNDGRCYVWREESSELLVCPLFFEIFLEFNRVWIQK